MAMPGYGTYGFDPNLPPEIDAEQQRIAKQQAIAEAMLQRGLKPLPTNEGPLHWTQGIAQMLNAYSGRKGMESSAKDRAGLGAKYQQGLADEVKRIATLRQGTPTTENIVDEQANGGEGAPAQIVTPGKADPRGAIQAALLSQYAPVRQMGTLEHRTFENEQTRENDRAARMQERILTLDAGAQNAALAREERAARAAEAATLRRELAQMQDTTRRDIAGQSAGLRRELAAQGGKPPAGYRFKPDGSMEAIPGGPADTKIQGAYNADTAALQSNLAALDRLGSQVKLTVDSNLGRTTGLMGMLPNVPGQPGAVSQARLDSLKSQVGFGVLQELRNTSKNGASGLGQVTEKEHAMLQQQLGNLEKAQGEEEIRRVLGEISQFVESSKDRIRSAYNVRHGQKQPAAAPGGGAPGAVPAGVDPKVWAVMTPEERALWK